MDHFDNDLEVPPSLILELIKIDIQLEKGGKAINTCLCKVDN